MANIHHERSPLSRLAFAMLSALFFILPFGIGPLTNLLLMGLLLLFFFIVQKKEWLNALRHPVVLFSWAYYACLALSLIYSSDVESGLRNLETKLSFLLAPPAILAFSHHVNAKMKNRMLKTFVLGNLAAFGYILAYATYRSIQYGATYYIPEGGTYKRHLFQYETFSEPLMHPGYLATYAGVAALVCFAFLIKRKRGKRFWTISLGVLVIEMLMLQGRINIIALAAVIFSFVFVQALLQKNYKLIALPFAVLVLVVAGVAFLASAEFKERYLAFPDFSYDIRGNDFNSATHRLAEWECASYVIEENFWTGTGIGDAKSELINEYREQGFKTGYQQGYNAHNQYLETILATGLVGLLLLLALIFCYLYFAFRANNLALLLTFSFMAVCMLTESMLERAWAVILLNVFFPFLIGAGFQNKKQGPKEAKE